MLPSQSQSHVLLAFDNERTLHFPVKLLLGKQTIETTPLIDSGAIGNFIDLGLLSIVSPCEYLPKKDFLDKTIQKISISTQLAQDAQTTGVSLPKWCKDFKNVFSEKHMIFFPHIILMTTP